MIVARHLARPGGAGLHGGDAAESDFGGDAFLATRELLSPGSVSKYLTSTSTQCRALQIRLSGPEALADITGLVEDIHNADGNTGAMASDHVTLQRSYFGDRICAKAGVPRMAV